MPGFDGTGPEGQGTMTGRGLGPCSYGMQRGFRRGMGRGFGRSRGFRYRKQIPFTKEEEKKILETDLKELEAEKEAIQERLKEI